MEPSEMETLIQKYKEQAMQYQKKSSDLYREEIPAQEVEVKPETPEKIQKDLPPVENPIRKEAETPSLLSLSEEEMPEMNLHGMGDVIYTPDLKALEKIIPQSIVAEETAPYTDVGRFQAVVSAADKSLPISFANLLVIHSSLTGKQLERYLQTDISGKTPVIELPAPPRALSEQPETNRLVPYGVYTVVASHPEYYTTIVRDVQVFGGQQSVLPISLIPLSEKSNKDAAGSFDFETGPHQLRSGAADRLEQ